MTSTGEVALNMKLGSHVALNINLTCLDFPPPLWLVNHGAEICNLGEPESVHIVKS